MYPTEYVFSTTLTPELKEEIQNRTRVRLSEILGIEVDDVMAQYVLVMIGNKKSMGQIAQDLVDFIGDEQAQQFVQWLSSDLPTLEATQAPTEATQAASTTADDDLEPPSLEGEEVEDAHSTPAQPAKRVVSLKGISATTAPPVAEKKVVSLSGKSGTIRTLSSHTDDMKAIMARRSQRFGVPEPKSTPAQDKTSENNGGRGTKRKANDKESTESSAHGKRPGSGGRLTQLLGPPVNVDQAELDARDSLLANKRKKTGRRDDRSNRSDQENHSDGDGNAGRRQNRRRQEGDKPDRPSRDGSNSAPPLPPGSPSDGRPGRDGGHHGNQPPHGGFRGPPGYGGYPPGPYGHPMFYPPPYGGMPPFGMGYPPHGMPRGPYMPPMPHGPPKYNQGPRGPRPSFQNRKWVNPNAAKTEEGEAGAAGADAANGTETSTNEAGAAGAALNPRAQTFAPRNPYFSSQMRPRFQNKTWVRQDPAQEQELSASLPQTPPQEQVGEASAQ